ncbi:mechanosensitive ion channel family protein [Parvularcula oceani]|uniref:mechanosensitive ion channel family protein n=1 Tax=Parvularcula oceani TaxID=1247963 RepID=UPI000B13634B|nr:mechanosensitive ion channel family protein [Parvularcula oceani]
MEEAQPAEVLEGAGEAVRDLGATAGGFAAWLRDNGVEWALALGIIAGVFLLLRLARAALCRVISDRNKPATAFRNIVADVVRATNSAFLLLVSVILVTPFFVVLTEWLSEGLQTAFMIFFTFQIAFWARVVVKALLARVSEKHSGDESTLANAMALIVVFANVVIFAIAIVVILDNLGMDVTGLIAGLGVGGIAIGLAAQSLFEDLFAGLSIILDKPFVRGDFIIFGDKMGSVEKVGLKSTRIRTLSGQQLTVNNSKLLDNEINNYRRMAERRIVTRVGVLYSTPHEKLKTLPGQIRQIVENTEGVRFDRCHLAAFADFSIVFELVFYVLSRDYNEYMDYQQSIFLDIHSLFEREDIEFAFPTQTIHIGSTPQSGQDQASLAAQ